MSVCGRFGCYYLVWLLFIVVWYVGSGDLVCLLRLLWGLVFRLAWCVLDLLFGLLLV